MDLLTFLEGLIVHNDTNKSQNRDFILVCVIVNNQTPQKC